MIAHVGVPTKDYEAAKKFYGAVLQTLGYKPFMDLPDYHVAGFLEGKHSSFWISEKIEPQPTHVAFLAKNKKEVDEFHKFALLAGGTDNGAPGYRPNYSLGYYAAFVLDADKNNIEAVWFDDEKEESAKKSGGKK